MNGKLMASIFIIGLCVGIAASMEIGTHGMKRIIASHNEAEKTWQTNFNTAIEHWNACTQREIDRASIHTVLYEPQLDAQPLGLVSMLARLGDSESNAMVTKRSVRWFIPYKVQPMVYDDIRGARYGYIDKEGKFEGWFVPQKVE